MGALSFHIRFSVGVSIVFWFVVVLFRRFSVVAWFRDKGSTASRGTNGCTVVSYRVWRRV